MDSMKELSNEEIGRYSRHITLPEVGLKGQEKLKSSSVLVIGAGGLGSPVLQYLAAAGIGRLGIVDGDVVDRSNLQRQVIHGMKTLDAKKVDSAKAFIENLNPNCTVETHSCLLTKDNCIDLFEKYDVICDGSDNFQTRYLSNDACILTQKPYIYGSILRFEGQVSVFNLTKDSPSYRDYIEEPPPPGLVPSCAEGGVLGVLPGLIGVLQATEVIKVILGLGSILDGRLLCIDSLSMKFREYKIHKNPNAKPITELVDYEQFCGLNHKDHLGTPLCKNINEITVFELKQKLETNERLLLVDVRTRQERDICKINGSIHIELKDFKKEESIIFLKEQSQTKEVCIYCKGGLRSLEASLILDQSNIRSTNIIGGILAWAEEIEKTMPIY